MGLLASAILAQTDKVLHLHILIQHKVGYQQATFMEQATPFTTIYCFLFDSSSWWWWWWWKGSASAGGGGGGAGGYLNWQHELL
jgi:hypothetical protein